MGYFAERSLRWLVEAINPDEEDRIIANAQRKRAARGDPALAKRVGEYHRNHRYMRDSHKYALAQIGSIHSPMVAAGLAAAARIAARDRWVKPGDVVKGGIRNILTAFSAPFEEIQAQTQALFGAAIEAQMEGGSFAARARQKSMQQFGTSTGAIALSKLAQGDRVDLGTGFMPGGKVRAEHLKAGVLLPDEFMLRGKLVPATEQDWELFGDSSGQQKVITAGRQAAMLVTEPGTRAFNTLSGLIDMFTGLTVDPVAPALKATSKAINSRKLIDEAGGVRGVRLGVLSKTAEQWLTGKGRIVVERLAEMTSFDEIWRATGKKLPVDLVRQIADAPNRDVVEALLRPELGVTIREAPALLRRPANQVSKAVFRKPIDSVRLLRNMPHKVIDMTDLDDAVLQVDRLAALSNMPAEKAAIYTERMARTEGRYGEGLHVVEDMMKDVDGVLRRKFGWTEEQTEKYVTLFKNAHDRQKAFFTDEIGKNVGVLGAKLDPVTGEYDPFPHMMVEYLNRAIPLPPLRELRSVTSKYGNLLTKPGVEIPEAFYGALIQELWKPGNLARLAWPVRVISELQGRMWGAGLDSLVSAHPWSYVLWVTRRKNIVGDLGEVTPAAIEDDFMKAMPAGSQGFRDPVSKGKIYTGNWRRYSKGKRGYIPAVAEEIFKMESDAVTREIAKRYNDPEAAIEWFITGPGQKFRKEMAKQSGVEAFLTVAGGRKHVNDTLRRIAVKTGGDPELIEAIATRQFRGRTLRDTFWKEHFLQKELRTKMDSLPPVITGEELLELEGPAGVGMEALRYWDEGLEMMFHGLMAVPESKLARSPAWKQFYWKDVVRQMPTMTPEAQKAFINVARSQKLPKGLIEQMVRRASVKSGEITITEATAIAKGFALEDSLKLLYNFHERSQFADAFRFIFPFGEAFKEVLTSWGRIISQNYGVVRRGQQAIQGARDTGFFQYDEASDQEMFVYPGSTWLSEKLLDVPMPLRGPVEGLNIIGSILPGVGPAVQMPVSLFAPDTPAWDKVKEWLLPFGETDVTGGFLESQMPGYMKRLWTAWQTDQAKSVRELSMASGDIIKYLASTGEYDTQDPEDIDRMVRDAKRKARQLFVYRGLAQFVAPSAPRPQAVFKDKTGKLMVVDMLTKEYRKNADEHGWDQAMAMFIDKYGDEARFVLQGKTHEVTAGVPTDEEGLAWIKAHPEIVEKYANTYGMFAPHGEDFSYDAYARALRKGDLQTLTPETMVRRANNRVAQMIYRNAKKKTKNADYLRALRESLTEAFPGFQDETGLIKGASTETIIRELQEAADDPLLAETQAGQALNIYLAAREKALVAARKKKLQSFATSDKMKATRAWLRDLADALVEEYPDFRIMWERGLSREGKMGAEE